MKDQLKQHIELINSKSGLYKTILYSENPLYYNVVTKVNYNVVKLWLENYNSKAKEPINKINWLVIIKSYRRQLDKELLNQNNSSNNG